MSALLESPDPKAQLKRTPGLPRVQIITSVGGYVHLQDALRHQAYGRMYQRYEMRNTIRLIRREARHLLRLCIVNGVLNDSLVRQVLEHVLTSKRHGYLALATQFERLVQAERQRHIAHVESEAPVRADLQGVVTRVGRLYEERA